MKWLTMNKRTILILVILILTTGFLYKLSIKEVLLADVTGTGSCCDAPTLHLYSDNTFKCHVWLRDDVFGSTCKGKYKIEGDILVLESKEIGELEYEIETAGDLLEKRYRFDGSFLISSRGYDLKIRKIDDKYIHFESENKK
jgi:hypothetical protein